MFIHVVRPGDTVYRIAAIYSVTPQSIIQDNELSQPDRLVVGQTLVIMRGAIRYTVRPGDTLFLIAARYNRRINDILQANPGITNPALLYPGQVILIPSDEIKLGTFEVNGYAYPGTSMDVLRKTFPYLTYLSIFSYNVNPDGSLEEINDQPMISAARQAGVAPIMVITNKGFDSDAASSVLNSQEIQDRLLGSVLQHLRNKQYYGLNIDFEYVYPSDRQNYNNFLEKASRMLIEQGFQLSTAIAPKISSQQTGLQYTAHDYAAHGRIADRVIIMTYEWGFTYGPPMPVAPLNEVRRVLDYAVTEIPRNKIMMGIPNYGYDWTLPFVKGTAARVVSNVGAVNLALNRGADIKFDPVAQSPYFYYYQDNVQHIVWFEDARSIMSKLYLAAGYRLRGVSYWTIGRYFPQNWLVLKSLYNIVKLVLR